MNETEPVTGVRYMELAKLLAFAEALMSVRQDVQIETLLADSDGSALELRVGDLHVFAEVTR